MKTIKNLLELETVLKQELQLDIEKYVSKYISVNRIDIKKEYQNRKQLYFIEEATTEYFNDKYDKLITKIIDTIDLKVLFKNSNKLNEIKSIYDLSYDKQQGMRLKLRDYIYNFTMNNFIDKQKDKMYSYFDILEDKLVLENNNQNTRKLKI